MKSMMLLCSLITAIPAAPLKGKVVGVTSGNAIEILSEGKIIGIRIAGIDCPAKRFNAGKTARRFVAHHAFMKDVSVEISGAASDGGLIGSVTLPGGMNLGGALVQGGFAWLDKGYLAQEPGLAALEKEARDACKGIWGGAIDEDDEDFGKDVLAKRESAMQDATMPHQASN